MKAWLQRFMHGRYGQDDLNRFLSIFTLTLCIVSIFTQWTILSSLAMVLLVFCIFRTFSRDATKRGQENFAFLSAKEKMSQYFRHIKTRYRQRKTHCFYRCPCCKQQLRVPKGKGHIIIYCPKCKTSFDKKT